MLFFRLHRVYYKIDLFYNDQMPCWLFMIIYDDFNINELYEVV